MRTRVFSPTYPTWALVGRTSRPAGETVQRGFTTEMSPKCVDSVRVASGRYQMEAIFIWMKAVAKCDVKLEKPKSFCTCNITVLEQALVCS